VAEKKTPPPRRKAPAGGPQFHIVFLLLAVLGVLWAQRLFHTATKVAEIPYSRFLELVDEKAVDSVSVTGDYVSGKFRKPVDGKREFVTTRVDADLADRLRERGVRFDRRVESTFLRDLLSWILPVVFFIVIWIFLMRRMGGGMGGGGGNFLSVGKSKARIYAETEIPVRFKDVAGVDEAKAELQEVVDFLKNPASYGRLGGRMPKGVLLVGPPGTGKTLLAKAVAGEAKVPFFSISGSEFVEMFVGVGAARVRDLFEQARKKAPAIIFIDELDALGRARSAGGFGGGGHDEKEQTLNQLLVEMDGFDSTQGLMLLAATNRPEILDPALLRAGRFDRQVLVDRPDKEGRKAILKVHLKKIQVSPALDLDTVSSITSGFTGADLANLVNEAALIATRRGAKLVQQEHFTEGMERIVAGLEKKSRILSQKEKEIVAHHEMGHALTGAAVPGSSAVHKVSIIPRGVGALGYTIQRPTEDRFVMTLAELEQKLCVLLGGRAAEKVIFGHLSTGASDDLSRATDAARGMAMRYGMVESLGHATYEREPQGFLSPGGNGRDYSEKTAAAIDAAVQDILDRAFVRTRKFLEDNLELLKESARDLLSKETLTEEELKPYFARIDSSALRVN
jgi:cell division protease FtsH